MAETAAGGPVIQHFMTVPSLLGGEPVRPEGPPAWPADWPEVRDAAATCLKDGSWGRYHGPNCKALTDELKAFHGLKEALLCASGTAAVELALRGVRVEAGDEVILAAYDFKANFQNVLILGATPVLVDIDAGSWQLDVSQLESAVTERTKAVIVSHLHGGFVSMPSVMAFAERHGLSVIEDACQATGATLGGQRAGTAGHVGVLSFGGSKLLTAGRGGAVLTDRPEIAQRIRLFTQRGNEAYPLSELQAATLRPQLRRLDDRNRIRDQSVELLQNELSTVAVSKGNPVLEPLVAECSREPDDRPAFFKVGFRYSPQANEVLSRDNFVQAIRAEGIAMDAGFRSLHRIHSKRRFHASGELSTADQCDGRVVILHHPVLLEERSSIVQIRVAVERVWQHAEKIQSVLGAC